VSVGGSGAREKRVVAGGGSGGERGEREKSGGSGAEAKTQQKNSFWWTGMVLVVIRLVSVLLPIATLCRQEKKRRRKSCHSVYEREELASYIPIAKPFLRHPSASGGVQLPCLPARCPPARCRSGEVRPVKCCFGMVPAGILPS